MSDWNKTVEVGYAKGLNGWYPYLLKPEEVAGLLRSKELEYAYNKLAEDQIKSSLYANSLLGR